MRNARTRHAASDDRARSRAIITGPPTSNARNTERRDQSICPSDRSKIRTADGDDVGGPARRAGRHHFTRYWKTAWRLSSGEVTSWIAPMSPDAASRREPRVERVGPRRSARPPRPSSNRRLSTLSSARNSRASARGCVRLDVDGVRMLVDQIADLVDVAFGEDPALVDQQDVRRHRLDLVQDVARDDDALAGARPTP